MIILLQFLSLTRTVSWDMWEPNLPHPKNVQRFDVFADLGLSNMILGQGHDTPLGHWLKFYEIPPKQLWDMARTRFYKETQMDWQTDMIDSYIPPLQLVCRGYNK